MSNHYKTKNLAAIRQTIHLTFDVVALGGYLITVEAKDGWRWRSSLSRNDSGGGACELVWVKSLVID